MTVNEWSLPVVVDIATAVAPDREMIVWTSVRRSYARVRDRTGGPAAIEPAGRELIDVDGSGVDRLPGSVLFEDGAATGPVDEIRRVARGNRLDLLGRAS